MLCLRVCDSRQGCDTKLHPFFFSFAIRSPEKRNTIRCQNIRTSFCVALRRVASIVNRPSRVLSRTIFSLFLRRSCLIRSFGRIYFEQFWNAHHVSECHVASRRYNMMLTTTTETMIVTWYADNFHFEIFRRREKSWILKLWRKWIDCQRQLMRYIHTHTHAVPMSSRWKNVISNIKFHLANRKSDFTHSHTHTRKCNWRQRTWGKEESKKSNSFCLKRANIDAYLGKRCGATTFFLSVVLLAAARLSVFHFDVQF